jgi:two-component system, LytTR family, sensor kinase
MGGSNKIFGLLNRYKTPLTHILMWAVFFLFPYIFAKSDYSEIPKHTHTKDEFFYVNLITNILFVTSFYVNYKIVIPKILYAKKYFLFAGIQILIFCLIMLNAKFLFQFFEVKTHFDFIRASKHNNFSIFMFVIISSVAMRVFRDKSHNEEKQKENLQTELSFLRSQISPHFLFNILNNIVAMVRLKHDGLEDTVVKLSSLLQYMLYETDEEKVTLQSEIEYLKSYVDLQSQRFGSKIKITTSFDIENSHLHIEPMLLIPFVENAFKHGYGMVENPAIDIKIKLENEILVVRIKNKYSKENQEKDKTSGIGLANVKRRLELLYHKKHTLAIEPMDEWFTVNLNLNLNNQ